MPKMRLNSKHLHEEWILLCIAQIGWYTSHSMLIFFNKLKFASIQSRGDTNYHSRPEQRCLWLYSNQRKFQQF